MHRRPSPISLPPPVHLASNPLSNTALISTDTHSRPMQIDSPVDTVSTSSVASPIQSDVSMSMEQRLSSASAFFGNDIPNLPRRISAAWPGPKRRMRSKSVSSDVSMSGASTPNRDILAFSSQHAQSITEYPVMLATAEDVPKMMERRASIGSSLPTPIPINKPKHHLIRMRELLEAEKRPAEREMLAEAALRRSRLQETMDAVTTRDLESMGEDVNHGNATATVVYTGSKLNPESERYRRFVEQELSPSPSLHPRSSSLHSSPCATPIPCSTSSQGMSAMQMPGSPMIISSTTVRVRKRKMSEDFVLDPIPFPVSRRLNQAKSGSPKPFPNRQSTRSPSMTQLVHGVSALSSPRLIARSKPLVGNHGNGTASAPMSPSGCMGSNIGEWGYFPPASPSAGCISMGINAVTGGNGTVLQAARMPQAVALGDTSGTFSKMSISTIEDDEEEEEEEEGRRRDIPMNMRKGSDMSLESLYGRLRKRLRQS